MARHGQRGYDRSAMEPDHRRPRRGFGRIARPRQADHDDRDQPGWEVARHGQRGYDRPVVGSDRRRSRCKLDRVGRSRQTDYHDRDQSQLEAAGDRQRGRDRSHLGFDRRPRRRAARPRPARGQRFDRPIRALAFSPAGRWVLAGGDDGVARVWDLTRRDPISPNYLSGRPGGITAVAFSPNDRWFATGGADQRVDLWAFNEASGPAGGAPVPLRGHTGAITALLISDDSHWVMSGSEEYLPSACGISPPRRAPPPSRSS